MHRWAQGNILGRSKNRLHVPKWGQTFPKYCNNEKKIGKICNVPPTRPSMSVSLSPISRFAFHIWPPRLSKTQIVDILLSGSLILLPSLWILAVDILDLDFELVLLFLQHSRCLVWICMEWPHLRPAGLLPWHWRSQRPPMSSRKLTSGQGNKWSRSFWRY